MLIEYQKAPQVTRNRLYIETMEEIYGENQKVIIDTSSSGNMLYLPIDKLINSSETTRTRESVRPSSVKNNRGLAPLLEQQAPLLKSRSSRGGR